MSISYNVLGRPGEDNAVHVVVDTGQALHPMLFDCGEGCAALLKVGQCQAIQHLCFSHFHMDHIAGFDTFFRHNYNRPGVPVHVWGPEQTIDVMHHRFRGFSWNLHEGQPGEWRVHEVGSERLKESVFLTREAFLTAHPGCPESLTPDSGTIVLVDDDAFKLEAIVLNHGSTPSIGYKVTEPERLNIDPARLEELGFKPGPWLRDLSNRGVADENKVILPDEKSYRIGDLREHLLRRQPGSSLAYLTDFALPTDTDRVRLVNWLKQTDTLICEAQYRHDDAPLAAKNHHMTTRLVGELARDAEVGNLVLQHVSRRYIIDEWKAMLAEAQSIFSATKFPDHWVM